MGRSLVITTPPKKQCSLWKLSKELNLKIICFCAEYIHMRKRPVVNDNNIKIEPRILLLFAKLSKTKLLSCVVKGKDFPYSTPSVGPWADPDVQAVSLQVTVSHPPGGRLPLLSARPAVISPAAEHHRPLAGTKLYCLVTEAHRCKQLA